MTATGIRWKIHDRYGNEIYLTHERWQHIIASINHPAMANYEETPKGYPSAFFVIPCGELRMPGRSKIAL